jgi:protocatechuate 3,4-dioxygenase beta subunit
MLFKKLKIVMALLLIATLACLGVCTLLPSAGTAAQAQGAKGDQPAQDAAKGKALTCTGRITDQATGKPVAGATVVVRWEAISKTGVRLSQVTRHQTDADGKYSFTVPPDKMKLYATVQVAHPDYVSRTINAGFLGVSRPGALDAQLDPGEEITGSVRTPGGEPAAGIRVVAVSRKAEGKEKLPMNQGGLWTHTRTDGKGRFRLKLASPGPAIFWILPDKHAPSEHRLEDKERGDRGTFTLKPGLSFTGKVLDVKGKPLAGVNVNARKLLPPEQFPHLLGLSDVGVGRSAVTNAKGEFSMEALAPGDYAVSPAPVSLTDYDLSVPGGLFARDGQKIQIYPVPDFFTSMDITLKEGGERLVLEIRAVPSVVITLLFVDDAGKPSRPKTFPQLNGELDKRRLLRGFQAEGQGKWTVRIPHGAEKVIVLLGQRGTSYKYRLKKGDPLRHVSQRVGPNIELGTVIDDFNIEIVPQQGPPPRQRDDPKKKD